jgi:hypothetical protein
MHSKELHNFYSLPKFVGVFKSRRMRWAGHVTCGSDKKNSYNILVRKLVGTAQLGDLVRHGRLILELILKK